MEKKANALLMTGMIVILLFNVLNLAAEIPHWAFICVTIFGVIIIACGVFLVIKGKKKK
jgi:uncharacterized protein (DUF983 family)